MVADLEVGTGRTGGRDATTGVIPGKYALSVGCPDIEPPSGWKWTALSSVAQLESGHTPSRKHPEYWDGGIPWIGIKDATENHGRTIHDTHQHVSDLGLQNSSARLLPANTVCLSRTASVGFVVVMGRPMATSQDFVNWICGPEIDPHFLKYVLLLENEALWRFARGTTHQTIYYPEAKAFHVCLPPLPEQKAIARILGTLDDKIELNRRMNATLETMARALFQSWFVDFDPVHAKAAGRPPSGMDAPTAVLFPASFKDSELGQIPTGWSVQRIEEIAERVAMGPFGSNIKRENFVEAGVPVIRGNNLTDGFVDSDFVYVTETKAIELQNSIAHRGDLVFTHRGTLGQVGLIHEDATFPRYIVSQSQMLLRIRRGALSPEAVYQFFRSSAGQQALLANTSQTGVPAIARPTTSLKAVQIVVPSPEVSSQFEQLVAPIRRQISNNTKQSRTLATLRDMLLPKLLSGELGVEAAIQ